MRILLLDNYDSFTWNLHHLLVPRAQVDVVRNDLQTALMNTRTIGALDDNHNGKVEVAELRGPMANLKPRFAELDRNKDGALQADELNAANPRAFARQAAETPDL